MPASTQPPTETLRTIETTLHGLSFSQSTPHLPTSTALAELLHLFSVGLLQADHGKEAYHALPHALARLATNSSVTALLDFSCFAPEYVDTLITYLWRTAASAVKNLHADHKADELTLDQYVVQLLHASHVFLLQSAQAPQRRSASANDAAGDLIFAVVSLDDTLTNIHAKKCIELLRDMRRLESVDQLLASFPSPLPMLLSNTPLAQNVRHMHFVMPVTVVRRICQAIARTRVTRRVAQVLDVLLPFVEDSETESRLVALDAVRLLTELSEIDWQRESERVDACLTGALIWRDVESALRVAPMLCKLVPQLLNVRLRKEVPVTGSMPQEWTRSVEQLLENAVYHLEHVLEEKERLEAGVRLGEAFVQLGRGRIVRYAKKWILVLARVMGRKGVAELLIESMKWTWIMEEAYRVDVVEGCLRAAMETEEVWEECLGVLKVLAESGRGELVGIAKELRELAARYGSLKRAETFLARVESEVLGRRREEIMVGSVVDRVFTLCGES